VRFVRGQVSGIQRRHTRSCAFVRKEHCGASVDGVHCCKRLTCARCAACNGVICVVRPLVHTRPPRRLALSKPSHQTSASASACLLQPGTAELATCRWRRPSMFLPRHTRLSSAPVRGTRPREADHARKGACAVINVRRLGTDIHAQTLHEQEDRAVSARVVRLQGVSSRQVPVTLARLW
jgi:hypothetical protein